MGLLVRGDASLSPRPHAQCRVRITGLWSALDRTVFGVDSVQGLTINLSRKITHGNARIRRTGRFGQQELGLEPLWYLRQTPGGGRGRSGRQNDANRAPHPG